jgi:formate dehydrogenase assembly factor FdhD
MQAKKDTEKTIKKQREQCLYNDYLKNQVKENAYKHKGNLLAFSHEYKTSFGPEEDEARRQKEKMDTMKVNYVCKIGIEEQIRQKEKCKQQSKEDIKLDSIYIKTAVNQFNEETQQQKQSHFEKMYTTHVG